MNIAPRFEIIPGGTTSVLVHPCSVCGEANAPFGERAFLLQGLLGTWFCASHWPLRAEASSPPATVAVLAANRPLPPPIEVQGDLF